MNQTGASRLMVVSGERLIGIITLKDMLQFLSLKMELEETADKAALSFFPCGTKALLPLRQW